MALLPILKYPDPILREMCLPVTDFSQDLSTVLNNMLETMYANHGIGLAGPQVGILQRLVVIDLSEDGLHPIFLMNPEILSSEEIVPSEEGCLSIPDYRDTVQRYRKIRARAQNHLGEFFEFDAEDLFAICVQHEIDHLNGVLFVDKLSRLKKEMFRKWAHKRAREER